METIIESSPVDARDVTAQRIQFVHRSLLRGIDRLVAAREDREASSLIPLFAMILRGHHDGEELVLFPALRGAGRMRSTDIAFLAAREHEHRAVLRLTDALVFEGMLHAIELQALLASHFADEEVGLSAQRLREMITNEQLSAQPAARADQAVVNAFFEHRLIRG